MWIEDNFESFCDTNPKRKHKTKARKIASTHYKIISEKSKHNKLCIKKDNRVL